MTLPLVHTQRIRKSKRSMFKTGLMTLVAASATMAICVDSAYAQRANRNNQEPAPAEGRQFGAKTGAIVLAAQEFMAADNYGAAVGELNKALGIPDINPYERSVINQMLGSSYYEMDQYSQAISSFENAISAGGLLPNEASNLRVNIAQLLIASDQFARGAQMLEDWNRNGGQLKPQHVEMLYQAWVQAEQYSRALPWAERWFNAASPKERKHFDVLNFLYNNLNMPGKQADIVKQMINRWPEENQLWDAWASMLATGGREGEAFEVSKMLYLGGAYSSEPDLLKVVQYYSYYDMPYQAAQILEREMNGGKISESPERLVQLSDLLRQSREYKKAIPVLERAAAASGKAKLYADLGEAYFNLGNCEKSEAAFRKAMDLGFDRGKSWILIATCRYDAAATEDRVKCPNVQTEDEVYAALSGLKSTAPWFTKRDDAIKAFDNVPVSSTEAKNGRKWKTFINAEKDAITDRCIFEVNVRKEQCFIAIRQAYSNTVFTGGEFILEDETCLTYKPAFDALYRKDKKDEE